MTYIERVVRTERQYERFDELTTYAHTLASLLDQAASIFPQHVQQLEAMAREAEAAKDAARDAIAGDF